MPAARKSQPPAEKPVETEPVAADADADAEVDPEAGEDETPLNRAARRAKGKTTTQAQGFGRGGKVVGGKGPAQGPRLWANRRSG